MTPQFWLKPWIPKVSATMDGKTPNKMPYYAAELASVRGQKRSAGRESEKCGEMSSGVAYRKSRKTRDKTEHVWVFNVESTKLRHREYQTRNNQAPDTTAAQCLDDDIRSDTCGAALSAAPRETLRRGDTNR
jgi:5'-3' exonuclease